MPEAVLIVALVCIPLLGVLALRRVGAFTVAEEVALIQLQRRLARERGLSVSERLQGRSLFRRFDDLRNLRRLLIIAGEDTTPGAWGLRLMARMLGVLALAIGVNALAILSGKGIVLDWTLVILLMAVLPAIAVLRLRLRAARYRENAGRAFGDLAAVLAAVGRPPLRNPASIEPTDLVAMMGSWIDDPALRAITDGNRWRELMEPGRPMPASESEWFDVIGEIYDIPAAERLAEVVRISRELNASDVATRYLATARDLSRERLATLGARNAKAMIIQVLPMIGMVLSLMILAISPVATIHLGGR